MFAVLELQKTDNGLAVISTTYDERSEAESKYHDILHYASVSSVAIHSAVIMSEDGCLLKRECYTHTQEAE